MAPGRTKTYTLKRLPSISTGSTILGSGGGLKEEWTRVSSRSKIRHFLPLDRGLYGLKMPRFRASEMFRKGACLALGGLTTPAAGTWGMFCPYGTWVIRLLSSVLWAYAVSYDYALDSPAIFLPSPLVLTKLLNYILRPFAWAFFGELIFCIWLPLTACFYPNDTAWAFRF